MRFQDMFATITGGNSSMDGGLAIRAVVECSPAAINGRDAAKAEASAGQCLMVPRDCVVPREPKFQTSTTIGE